MPDTNALTLAQLRTAVLGRRFPAASQTTNATRWLATAYQDVWSASTAWSFKRVSLENLAVVAGDYTPAMPAAFGDAIKLFDARGNEIPRLAQEEWEACYTAEIIQATRGVPEAYCVVNREIQLAPIPQSTTTFKLSYLRRLAHKQADGTTVAAGFMDAEDDYPLWSDHHAILIPRAQAIGLQEMSDPTWQLAQAEYERELDRMIDDYVPRLTGQMGDAWYA